MVVPSGTLAGRFGPNQSGPANTLVRSRGWVVPRRVLPSQVFCPTFFSVMYAGSTSLTVMVMVVLAYGHDCSTNFAAPSAPPANCWSAARSPLNSSRSTAPEMPLTLPLSAVCHTFQLDQPVGMLGQLTPQCATQSG